MPDFKKGGFNKDRKPGSGFARGGDRPSYGAPSRRPQGGGFGSIETHSATCSKCNARCEVPFKPNGKKPIFCKDCYVRDDAGPSGKTFERREQRFERPDSRYDRPAFQKPAASVEDPRIGAMQKELSVVHAKLDALVESLHAAAYSSILTASNERTIATPEKAGAKATAKKAAKKAKKA
ncbi:MAG TPA: CxxC-x17-CxxC domain-containing protein [Candidatus Paceibacterota bacterium]|nr:CxxC-x17-CxxC domain-containing protein [Candidatus Paceibacterota bacterium]